MSHPSSISSVPERSFFNEFGQRITVRLVAGKIMVRHPGIPIEPPPGESTAPADRYWEYIPSQILALPDAPVEVDTMEPEPNVFDIVSAPKAPPLKSRMRPIPADSRQYQLTDTEISEIEYCAAILTSENEKSVADWIQSLPEDAEEENE